MKFRMSKKTYYSESYGCMISIWQFYFNGIIRCDKSKPPTKLIAWQTYGNKTIKKFHKRIKL